MIKIIAFDYGQVITFAQDPKAVERIAQLAGVEKNKFEAVLWKIRSEYDRGTMTVKEYYREVLSGFNVSLDENIIDKMIYIDHESWKNLNPQTMSLMEDVKNAGYLLGILSNMPHDFLAWARQNVPVLSISQINLFSCDVNFIKPEKEIYQKFLSLAGVQGPEVVFFDDKPENVKGARSLGIKAFIWENSGQARRQLLSLGVKFQ